MPTSYLAEEKAAPDGLSSRRNVEPIEFRQLRHQTKNALQRILIHVLEAPGVSENLENQRLAHEVARRIELAAAISDALFGFTRSLEPLFVRLQSLAESVIALYTDTTQIIRLDVTAMDGWSPEREETILRIAHELVGNAVKHGMHMRLLGRISVWLFREAGGSTVLSVANDGWQMENPTRFGEGFELVEELARAEGGIVKVMTYPQTVVEVRLPDGKIRPPERSRVARTEIEIEP